MTRTTRLQLARITIAAVLLWNVQCAVLFLARPEAYTASFELADAPGEAAIRGLGLLFLMWNIPYAVALWHPICHRTSLFEALAMQAIGLVGETFILVSLPSSHGLARTSLLRFIVFDALGLLALLVAIWLTRRAVYQPGG